MPVDTPGHVGDATPKSRAEELFAIVVKAFADYEAYVLRNSEYKKYAASTFLTTVSGKDILVLDELKPWQTGYVKDICDRILGTEHPMSKMMAGLQAAQEAKPQRPDTKPDDAKPLSYT